MRIINGYEQQEDGAWRRIPTPEEAKGERVQIWYMRDNCTFRPLPLNADAAIAAMSEEFDDGNAHGMLCGSPRSLLSAVIHAPSADRWDEFERNARSWLEEAVALNKVPGREEGR